MKEMIFIIFWALLYTRTHLWTTCMRFADTKAIQWQSVYELLVDDTDSSYRITYTSVYWNRGARYSIAWIRFVGLQYRNCHRVFDFDVLLMCPRVRLYICVWFVYFAPTCWEWDWACRMNESLTACEIYHSNIYFV